MPDTLVRPHVWEGVSKSTGNAQTAREAMITADLDWEVAKRPMYFDGVEGRKLSPMWAVVRTDNDRFLGGVRKSYECFQNWEHFQFGDNLVDSGDAHWVWAGSIRSDRLVFMIMQLPEDILIAGHDVVKKYILIASAHDGSKSITISNIPERLSCTNQLGWASRHAAAKFSIRHLPSARGQLEEARNALNISLDYMDNFEREANLLYSQSMVDDEFRRLTDKLIPDRPKKDDVLAELEYLWQNSPTMVDIPKNGWRAVNAIGEYFDHTRDPRTAESQMVGSIFGVGKATRNKAVKLLLPA